MKQQHLGRRSWSKSATGQSNCSWQWLSVSLGHISHSGSLEFIKSNHVIRDVRLDFFAENSVELFGGLLFCYSSYSILFNVHAVHCFLDASGVIRCLTPESKEWCADRWAPLQTCWQTTTVLQEVSATLRCMDPIWHSREEGYSWGVVCYLCQWSPTAGSTKTCLASIAVSKIKKWTKSGFICWWCWCFVKVSSLSKFLKVLCDSFFKCSLICVL